MKKGQLLEKLLKKLSEVGFNVFFWVGFFRLGFFMPTLRALRPHIQQAAVKPRPRVDRKI